MWKPENYACLPGTRRGWIRKQVGGCVWLFARVLEFEKGAFLHHKTAATALICFRPLSHCVNEHFHLHLFTYSPIDHLLTISSPPDLHNPSSLLFTSHTFRSYFPHTSRFLLYHCIIGATLTKLSRLAPRARLERVFAEPTYGFRNSS